MKDSRHTRRTCVALAAIWLIAALLVVPSPATAVDPAVSEYSLNFPNAKGKSYPGADTPSANSSELGPLVREALRDRRRPGEALAAIATSPELGAPDVASDLRGEDSTGAAEVVGGENPSALTAIFRTLDDVPVILGLLALLGVVAFLAFLARTRPAGKET